MALSQCAELLVELMMNTSGHGETQTSNPPPHTHTDIQTYKTGSRIEERTHTHTHTHTRPLVPRRAALPSSSLLQQHVLLCHMSFSHACAKAPGSSGELSKQELIAKAQPFCDASFVLPDAGSCYT